MEIDINVSNLQNSVRTLINELPTGISGLDTLQEFLKVNIYEEEHVQLLFNFLSKKLPDPAYTDLIATSFEPFFLLILTSALHCKECVNEQNYIDYQKKCVALAKLLCTSPDAKSYATLYFHGKPAPFILPDETLIKPKLKKLKNVHEDSAPDKLTILRCCYQLLSADPVYFKELWDWSAFVQQFWNTGKGNDLETLYCNYIMCVLTNMNTTDLCKLNRNIPEKILVQFDEEQYKNQIHLSVGGAGSITQEQNLLKCSFESDHVTNIEGVLLSTFNSDNYKFYAKTDGFYDKIVRVDSTRVNLRSIALGIAASKAICLSGPVGSGKTTLIEYLARKTGRICPKPKEIVQQNQQFKKQNQKPTNQSSNTLNTKNKSSHFGNKRKSDVVDTGLAMDVAQELSNTNGFLRIQLGDQTDSKMLLGQYRCTDVPGEFIWLPGVLTQAVMNGYWLLLEDLDSATPDTYTILSGLLENRFLNVPGFRDCIKIEPGFQLFVTVRKYATNSAKKSLYSILEKYLYTVNILPLSRNELCKVVSSNYPKLATVANRIVDVFLTFSSGDHSSADHLRQQENCDKADTTEKYTTLPFEAISLASIPNSGRLVSTRDLIKLCQRSNPVFSVTSAECAYFVFQNAVDVFCSYLPQGKEKTRLIISIGAKLGIIQSRCEYYAGEYKPEIQIDLEFIKAGRAELFIKSVVEIIHMVENGEDPPATKKPKLHIASLHNKSITTTSFEKQYAATFSFTRLASCILERIAVCVAHDEPVLLVGETGVGKTSSVQYLAERTQHKLVVVNMNNQSDVSDLIGGFKPVDLAYVVAPLRSEFEFLFRYTFNPQKNEAFLSKFGICYNQANFSVLIKLMIKVVKSVFEKSNRGELGQNEIELLPRWQLLKVKLLKLNTQLAKSINISFAFIPGSLVNCIKYGDWVLLDEINLASAETLECLSTILEPDGSVVLLEKGEFTPVKRHPEFRIFACMNPNTDIGKKDLSVGIRNRFTEFFVDEITADADLSLLISDYLRNTGIQKKSVTNIVKLYKRLKELSRLELNDGLGNKPVFSLRTLCRSMKICAKNLCGSIERNLYESFCMSFLTQLDVVSHNVVLRLIQDALLSNTKAILKQTIPKPGDDYLNFEGYWIQQGPSPLKECTNYILTESVKDNLRDLARIISIGKLPVLLQGPTSAGKTSLIEYIAKKSGNHCLRINNHEHTDLQEYIGTYTADVTGRLSFKEGVLAKAMRNGYWMILDELNLAATDILEALNRVLDDNRELFIPETQTVIKAHPNFMLFATQNPPGLYGGRKTLSRAFKNRFIELHFSEIPRHELEIILEKRCLIPASYSKKMVMCMSDLQKNRKTTTNNVFTLRDLFRWGNRYTYADKTLLGDTKYDWNQHLVEEGYLVLSAKVRTNIEIEIIEDTLYRNFRKRINLDRLFGAQSGQENSQVTGDIITSIRMYKERGDIVWTRNMTRMAVLAAKALQFNEPILLVGPTGCGKTTVCQILASIRGVNLRILNCHMHTEGSDFLGGLRPFRQGDDFSSTPPSTKLFEWADGPLIFAMQEGSYFMADEISLAEDSVLERLNCVLEPERTLLLAEKGGMSGEVEEISKEFVVQGKEGFQFLATMNPGGDFGKKELSPALRNRFTEIWCLPSDAKEDLIKIASNCMKEHLESSVNETNILQIATFLVEVVCYIRDSVEKFKFSVRDIIAWANYITANAELTLPEKAIFGLETIFLDALEMYSHETLQALETTKENITRFAMEQVQTLLHERFTLDDLETKRGTEVVRANGKFGIKPFFIATSSDCTKEQKEEFLFDTPTTKKNLFRLLSALSLKKPVLLEGPPGVGKTSTVESIASTIGYRIVRINLCEHTDLADLFGTDLPAEDNVLEAAAAGDVKMTNDNSTRFGSFVWRDGPLLAALKAENTWILLDELNLAPQSVLEGLNAILDHRGEVYIPELNKSFQLNNDTRIFACQNPLKQGGGRKGLPQSFLNRFNKVYLRKLTTDDLLYVVNRRYHSHFDNIKHHLVELLTDCTLPDGASNLFDVFKQWQAIKYNPNVKNKHRLDFDISQRLVKFSEMLDQGITAMEFGYKGGPFEINLRDILRWCDLLVNKETGFICEDSQPQLHNMPHGFRESFERFLLTLYERMKLVYYQRMRDDHDKLFIRNAFASAFCCDAEHLNQMSEDVSLYWTDANIYLNDIVLPRVSQLQTDSCLPIKSKEAAPFLLSSQRELLKNVVECVHIKKPVLLCGATDTGKSKIVNVLCTLSNQLCNTDTIDDSVTGSFQQTDLNRHLEKTSQKVEAVLMDCLQRALFENNHRAFIALLLNKWSSYNSLARDKAESNAMSEELVLFRKRIQHLDDVIEQLFQRNTTISNMNTSHNTTLAEQRSMLNLLRSYTNSAHSLNTGGSFEWVDSQIVTSLKCGQYILLEHANLCSSAVLDRLNSVFEPNGNLLISEKGVSVHDTSEIVEKKPNFRAFLTIDPKHGELSRAMRNRCIELALEHNSFDLDDMRSLVYAQGIHAMEAINCILNVHSRICALTEINPYNISHLTQFSFLTASYKRIGYAMERAIYVSGMEVYVYSCNTDYQGYGLPFYQNRLREIVLEGSKSFAITSNGVEIDDIISSTILSSGNLTSMAMIKLQATPLKLVLRNETIPQPIFASLFTGFDTIDWSSVTQERLASFLIYFLYECSSMTDLDLRYHYLQNILGSHTKLQNLTTKLYRCVQPFRQYFTGLVPAQLPWNLKLLPRIRHYTTQSLNQTSTKIYNLSSSLILCLLLESIPEESVTKLSKMSALTYSQSVASGSITDKLNNGFLQHLSTMLTGLQNVLTSSLATAPVDLNGFTKLITAILWFNRLLSTSREKLFINKDVNTDLIKKMLLHFTWLDKHLIKMMETLQPEFRQTSPELEHSLQKLINYALSVRSPLNLLRKVYAKQMTEFQPFYHDAQITVNALTQTLQQTLNVVPCYGAFPPDLMLRKFLAQRTDAAKRAIAIVKRVTDNKYNYKFKEVALDKAGSDELPAELQEALIKFVTGLKDVQQVEYTSNRMDNCDFEAFKADVRFLQDAVVSLQEPLEESAKPKDLELRMLPLREYFLNRALIHTMASYEEIADLNDINEGFCEATPSLTCDTWQLVMQLKTSKHKHFSKCWSKISSYIGGIEEFSDFGKLFVALNGSYKHLLTYRRLIHTALLNHQLQSLAANLNCSDILRSNENLDSHYVYSGPSIVSALSSLIFQDDGSLKSVPLNELKLWKRSLCELSELLWHNSVLMTPIFSTAKTQLQVAQRDAKHLLCEVDFVRRKCEKAENENFSDYNTGFQKLTKMLAAEYSESRKITSKMPHESLNQQQMQYRSAVVSALIGTIELCLLTFTPLIDPVEKSRVKNVYIADDINCLTTLTTVYDFMKIIMKYKHFGAEIYSTLEERIKNLKKKQQLHSQKVALRPGKCLYSSLVQDIAHFLKTNCEPQSMCKLIEAAQQAWASLTHQFTVATAKENLQHCTETMGKIELWLANSQHFVNHILNPYTDYYQDFLQPLRCSVTQLRFGLERLKMLLSRVKSSVVLPPGKHAYENINNGGQLHVVLANISEFPTTHSLDIFNVHSSQDILKNRSAIFALLDQVPQSEHDYFLLLKAKLTELHNLVSISNNIGQEAFHEFDFALNVCNQMWQHEEECRRKQKVEDESLYVNKTKCASEDDEILELAEIEENFPTHVQEDFGEFLLENTLKQVMKLDQKKDLKSKCSQVVRDEDYGFLAQHFITMMVQYSEVYYHKPTVRPGEFQLDLIRPFKQRMQVFIKLFSHYKPSLNSCLDAEAYNSFVLAAGLQQHLLNEVSLPDETIRPYNFYKDTNLQEIISCTEVLSGIEERVNEQLALYPEHASLLDIKRVSERIRALPSTLPVARFNAGFQILRKKMSQWNEVAHKGNHLRQEEIVIAEYVQKWTKLELQCWRNCLSQTYEKIESQAFKYWFFIYNLIQEFIMGNELDNSFTDQKYTEKRFIEGEILDAINVQSRSKLVVPDIIKILRQFVEAACYGDFHVRLQLLQAFELYLHNRNTNCGTALKDYKDNRCTELVAGLRNLQIHFKQFVEEIEGRKKKARLPIEKKLKEFVKIESYNKDLSYFSMRNNVARVHRHLNKFLKEYEQELKLPITSVFQAKDVTNKDYIFSNDKGKELRYDTKMKYYLVDCKHFVAPLNLRDKFGGNNSQTEAESGEKTVLQKIGKLFSTSRNVVKETITNAQFPKLIIALDVLLSDQLERCGHLRNLTVDRTKERAKQILEAKQILQQKRKGLNDLFKILVELGLNFKTGLLELSLRDEFDDYTLPPFCIQTTLESAKDRRSYHQNMLHLNEHLDTYYAKCAFKLKLLQNQMLTPLSELDRTIVDRIKGFAIDFFLLVQRQRQHLSNSARSIFELRSELQHLKDIAEVSSTNELDTSQVDFVKTRCLYLSLKQLVCRIRYVFQQFNLLVNCLPHQLNAENQVFSGAAGTALQSYPQLDVISNLSTEVLALSKSILNDMIKHNMEFLSIQKLDAYFKIHAEIVNKIKKIRNAFSTNSHEYVLPLAKCFTDLLAFSEQLDVFSSAKETEGKAEIWTMDYKTLDSELEHILNSILISMQKLYKKYQKSPNADDAKSPTKKKPCSTLTGTVTDNQYDAELQEQHLKKELYCELRDDWGILNVSTVATKLSYILLSLKHAPASSDKVIGLRKAVTLLPILEQYNLMVDYYLCQQLGAHKVSAKMLSVMLSVFLEISTKGFCVPAELMQDKQGENQQDKKSGEGFGLEDGTGENDVSDKIESEDQLDDAKRPEDRQNEADKKENSECKEEKGIEMSDDFDGEMQDIDKNEEDDSGTSEDEEDFNKEMGETEEGADKLDDQIWGDDENTEQDEEQELNEEESGNGTKDEQDSHNDLNAKNDAASKDDQDERENSGLDATENPEKSENQSKSAKDIDHMQDPEMDEEQMNPYHNELEEPPIPEDMELGDMNNVNDDLEDEEHEKEGDQNPFDIDAMKENMQPFEEPNKDDDTNAETDKAEEDHKDSDDSDSEDNHLGEETQQDKAANEQDKQQGDSIDENNTDAETQKLEDAHQNDTQTEVKDQGPEEKVEEETKEYEQSKDKCSKQDNMHSVPEKEQKGSADQTEMENGADDVKQDQKLDDQETGEDKDGVGQAENENVNEGHQGIAETKDTPTQKDQSHERQTHDKRKLGKTDQDRTIGETEDKTLKQLKTIDQLKEQTHNQLEDENKESDNKKDVESTEYQHVQEAKKQDKTTLDSATEEQSKQIQHKENEKLDEEENEAPEQELNEELMEIDNEEVTPNVEPEERAVQNFKDKSEKLSKSDKPNECTEAQKDVEVEGDVVPTMSVARSNDTTAHYIKEILLDNMAQAQDASAAESLELRKMYQQQIMGSKPALPQQKDYESWQTISNRMAQNARELCEQLRLILEPTKCTRLKGDYRTGRRINMKKIIPYIASQFRKDKIWLRRTKPAQRDYKITIAIDDSKSMHHNNSKTLTLEAISLVSQALTLLESGRLSIVSFGESPQIILNHTSQFDGPKLVSSLNFSQNKTKIAELLDFIRTINTEEFTASSDNGLFENLLLVLSDGRNIFSEGKAKVKNSIKLARLQRIFLVYIIIDNPENKNSILDIQMMEMLPDKGISIKDYLDEFPFPYYVIVRDLNQLPHVLSEAMRQWFELVNSEQ